MAEHDRFVEDIADFEDDFAAWYQDVVKKAELAELSDVRGCMVIRPYGYALWENMQAGLDARFKATGHVNAYFPLFIPESLFRQEAELVEGFNPELPWITEVGGEKLPERLAVRPTSEAIILKTYSKWVQSWRDLPILINQWANVVRWEKRPRLFLRTVEFLWQEGHTVHRTEDEAHAEVAQMLEVYREFAETELAMPVVKGRKSEKEKFAGALETYTIEAMMGDGRALQSGTSHFFGQRFARAFGISFLDMDGQRRDPWTTSWGASTRLVGGVIMTHGDESGLILPPRVAPYQVVIVPIFRNDDERSLVLEAVQTITREFQGRIRLHVDWSDNRPGWKYSEWEMRGVPLRLEIGPRDVAQRQALSVRRDTRAKEPIPFDGLATRVSELLLDIQQSLLERARAFRESRTFHVATIDELVEQIEQQRGFFWGPWCGSPECESQVKARTGATLRCIPLDGGDAPGSCLVCQSKGTQTAIFAQAY